MLSEQDKQAILNGDYGINRNGDRVKCIFKSENVSILKPYLFITYRNNEENLCWLNSNLSEHEEQKESWLDVIGLWKEQNELEPFNLKRALSGEPIITRDGCKAYITARVEQPEDLKNYTLTGYGFNGEHKEFLHWDENGRAIKDDISCDDIIGMWQEHKRHTITLTLPCPLKVINKGEIFFRYTSLGNIAEEVYKALKHQERDLERGRCFSSREDAKAWVNALKNNRK